MFPETARVTNKDQNLETEAIRAIIASSSQRLLELSLALDRQPAETGQIRSKVSRAALEIASAVRGLSNMADQTGSGLSRSLLISVSLTVDAKTGLPKIDSEESAKLRQMYLEPLSVSDFPLLESESSGTAENVVHYSETGEKPRLFQLMLHALDAFVASGGRQGIRLRELAQLAENTFSLKNLENHYTLWARRQNLGITRKNGSYLELVPTQAFVGEFLRGSPKLFILLSKAIERYEPKERK
ncbi:MAG: hypothetical protein R3A13_12110 [Bdellovibrionota bacterium]